MGGKWEKLEDRYAYLTNAASLTMSAAFSSVAIAFLELERIENGFGQFSDGEKLILLVGMTSFFYLPQYPVWRRLLQGVNAFTTGMPGSTRTKISEYGEVKSIETTLKTASPPNFYFKGTMDGLDFVKGSGMDVTVNKLKKNEIQSPGQLISFGINHIISQKFSEGYGYIQEGFDRLDGRRILHDKHTRVWRRHFKRELKRQKFFHIKDVEPCLALAVYSAVAEPEKAWYYSELAKRLSDKFLPNKRKQAYLFSSLISTFQQRDDEKKQWEDTIKILHSEPQWERLGESRSVVKRCSLDDFFKNSIVLKESSDRNGLVHEAAMLNLVKQTIPHIKTPRLLHVTREPINQNYFLVMRFEKGAKTLYDLLQDDPKTPIEPFLDVTCEILKKVNNDFPRQNLFKKIMSKIKSPLLNLPENLANSLIERFEPITQDLEKTPFGYKKDSISQNLYKVGDQYGAFDFEGNEKVPKLIEFVNLVYYPLNPPIKDIEKLALLFKELSAERGEYSSESYFLNLHQANVYRSFCFLESGSVPGKVNIRASRKISLENAIQSLDFIIDNEQTDNYKYLRADLEEVKKHIQEPYIS